MERRVTSHTEEEEMNQRRRLLTLARKGDQKSIQLLFELYQVKVFSGEALKKKKLPTFPVLKPSNGSGKSRPKATKNTEKTVKAGIGGSQTPKREKEKVQAKTKGLSKNQRAPQKARSEATKSLKLKSQKKIKGQKTAQPKKKSPRVKSNPQKVRSEKKSRITKKK